MSFNQWRCALLPRPTYFGLQRLRHDILGGATQRDAVSVAIRATDYVLRQEGGLALVRGFYEALKTQAPSETLPLIPIPADVIREAPVSPPPMPAPPPTPPQLVAIRLRHRHWINGISYGPGAAEVLEDIAPELLAQDRRVGGSG